jgi:phosphoheptose isomerase
MKSRDRQTTGRPTPRPTPVDTPEDQVTELDRVLREFLRTRGPILEAAAEALSARLRAGGQILIFGNGGSAAEAQHFAAELVNGFLRHDRPPLPAIALTADTSSLTAVGNDRGFATIFSRQVEAFGRPGDAAVALTTSGRSPNIVRALRAARAKGLLTVALTGRGGDKVPPLADYLLDVPSCSTPRIQEAHLFILHGLAGRIEGACRRPEGRRRLDRIA